MRFVFALAVLFCLFFVSNASTSPLVDASNVDHEFELVNAFKSFQAKFDKKYASVEEEGIRYQYFVENMARAKSLTAKSKGKTTFGINQFSDLHHEEFKRLYNKFTPAFGAKAAARKSLPVHQPSLRVGDVPAAWDWRQHGAVTPVKDQGQCGSCWAFSATEEVESAWLRAGQEQLILAPQQTVDCDTGDNGCGGGDTISAYAYMETAGLETEAAYPYVSGNSGSAGTCAYNKNAVKVHIANYSYATPGCNDACSNQDEQLLQTNLYEVAPVSVCVDASVWQSYTGGVLDSSSGCQNAYSALDHCVQLVGYGLDPVTKEKYWLVRNSWNTSWGENGYIRLKFGENTCGIADEATLVQIQL